MEWKRERVRDNEGDLVMKGGRNRVGIECVKVEYVR